jgi:methyl-accepting chemotaxis protein
MASACTSTSGRRPSATGSLSRSPDASKRASSRWSTKVSDATRSMQETAVRLTATGGSNHDEAQGALGRARRDHGGASVPSRPRSRSSPFDRRHRPSGGAIRDHLDQGRDEAQRTGATVQGLADAAQRIGEVVRFINDIASQTSLQE